MDSKYSAIQGSNEIKFAPLKRKISIENFQVSKLKLSKGENKSNGQKIQNLQEHQIQTKQVITENLQELRRQLPVFMVRGRYDVNNTYFILGAVN